MNFTKKILRLLGHQENVRFGVRDRVIRFFHHPDRANSEEFVVPFFGLNYRGNFNTFLDWSVFYYGAYAREELRLIKEVLEPISQPIVFDIGANIGHHTLYMAQHSKRVFAFEPYQELHQQIVERLNDNKIKNVELCEFGLGSSNSLENYFPPVGANTGTGSFVGGEDSNRSQSLKLEIKRGDDIVKEKGINKIHFLKIDTEGFEPFVLSGLKQTLEAYRPVVFFEWSENSKRAHESKTPHTLFPTNYLVYQFVSDTPVFKLFRQPFYRLELRHNLVESGNLLAVPKEYIKQVNGLKPLPIIARRLNSASD